MLGILLSNADLCLEVQDVYFTNKEVAVAVVTIIKKPNFEASDNA